MTYALIRHSIAPLLLFGIFGSQFVKALGNLRRGGRTADGRPVPRSAVVAAMIVCLCVMMLGVYFFAESWHPRLANDTMLDFALVPFGLSFTAMGLRDAMSGVWDGIIRQRRANGSEVLDRTKSSITGVTTLLWGLAFVAAGFVLLYLVFGPRVD